MGLDFGETKMTQIAQIYTSRRKKEEMDGAGLWGNKDYTDGTDLKGHEEEGQMAQILGEDGGLVH